MRQNKYDDQSFYEAYSQMPRSLEGLEGAGEWHTLKELVPNLKGKHLLDLGCGFGWHSRYFNEQGAEHVIGIDLSANMIQQARQMTSAKEIEYVQGAIEDISFKPDAFDFIFSSLALHYVEDYKGFISNVKNLLVSGGELLFSVEHPVFTARAEQDWFYDANGQIQHWPLDHYQEESIRSTTFLTENVVKYHRTLSTYLNELLFAGFVIERVEEPKPDPKLMEQNPAYKDELRRPMFLIIKARLAN
ncbi:class I SAM-dependent methyltransferase [Shouchella sp. 1P09AA]|uniref:class I SAM-dependent methyltransferase n=1 Tax=unclassified Shouchella TaxID=2893065 RepID=UPI0039A3B6FA